MMTSLSLVDRLFIYAVFFAIKKAAAKKYTKNNLNLIIITVQVQK